MTYEAPGLVIGNARRKGRGSPLAVINPATEEVLDHVLLANEQDVADAVTAAERGFAEWRRVGPWARSDVLRKVGGLIRERMPEIARLLTLEVGKPIGESELEVISG